MKIWVRVANEKGMDVAATIDEAMQIAARATTDTTIWVTAAVAEILRHYLETDVSVLWVQYGIDSDFTIFSDMEWIIT